MATGAHGHFLFHLDLLTAVADEDTAVSLEGDQALQVEVR
jgi:hypothetical protein